MFMYIYLQYERKRSFFDREWNSRSLQSLFDDNHHMVKFAWNCSIILSISCKNLPVLAKYLPVLAKYLLYLPNSCQILSNYLSFMIAILLFYLSNACQMLAKFSPTVWPILAKCLPMLTKFYRYLHTCCYLPSRDHRTCSPMFLFSFGTRLQIVALKAKWKQSKIRVF